MNTENILNECSSTNTNQTYYDFSYLPPHIIAKVFNFLNLSDFKIAATTCHSWNMASCDPQFAKRFTITIGNKTRIEERYIVRPVKSIRFNQVVMHRSDARLLFQWCGHQMEEVVLHRCELRFNELFRAIYYMPGIKVLKIDVSLSNYSYDLEHHSSYSDVFKKYYSEVKKNLNGIKSLEININLENLTTLPYPVYVLLTRCKHLETLVWNRSQHSKPQFCSKLLDKSSRCIPNSIRSLTIHGLSSRFSREVFEQLIDLDLTEITRLSLKRISNSYYDNIFRKFCIRYCALESLELNGFNALQLSDICSYMPNLKSLSLHLNNLTTINLVEIATDIRIIGKLRHLEKLQLNVDNFRVALTCHDESLSEIFPKLNNLKELNLNRYPVSNRVLNSICTNCKQITILQLTKLETNNLQPIFENLVQLKWLDITFPAEHLTTFRVDFTITNLKFLEVLEISRFAPGMTLQLIEKLPILMLSSLEKIRRIHT